MDETRHDLDTQDLGTMPSRSVRHDAGTRLDGRSASTDDVTLRFGPGVPPRLAGVWREGRPRRKRPLARRILSGLVTLGVAVLTGLVVWFLLRSGPKAEVTGVTVSAPAGVQGCGATATVVGVIRTNGGQGDVSYRWKRSDGQVSGVFTDTVPRGRRSIEVPLRWTVKGTGTLHAVATLEVLSPKSAKSTDGTASAGFEYECR
jgi:hypothetical protein